MNFNWTWYMPKQKQQQVSKAWETTQLNTINDKKHE